MSLSPIPLDGAVDGAVAHSVPGIDWRNSPEFLVAQGRTVLLVTHDKDIAQRADRVITLVDGEIKE